MSEIEQFWEQTAPKFNDQRKWSELTLQQQQVFIQGINHILAVFHKLV